MLNARSLSFFPSYSRNNGLPNADLQLATRMKNGRCTSADEARLNTLLASQEGNPFFENPAVQRKLVKGVLDGTLTDQRIVDRLKDCAVCLTQDDQIDLIRRRTRVITDLSPGRCAEIGFVLRFFCAEQQSALCVLNTQLRLPEESVDVVQTTTPTVEPISSDQQQEKQDSPAFETIANSMFGTAMKLWNVCDAFSPQGEVLDHEQLARAILDKTESQTERQQFETMLASDEERAAFFNDSVVQVMIVEALHERPQIDPDMLLAIAQHLSIFTDPEVQKMIAWAISAGKFGTDPAVLQAIAQHLAIFTDPLAQYWIAVANWGNKFGTDPAVRRAATQHLTIFTHPVTPKAQQAIASAIDDRKFGTDPAVLQTIAQHLSTFSDSTAQQTIAEAIRNSKFGTDPVVLLAIAQHLSIFTNPEAQYSIAMTIKDGYFGTDSAVLQAIAQHLFIFTNPAAQRTIAWAIRDGYFGTDSAVLQEIAQRLSTFTDPLAQYLIAAANWGNRFGTDSDVRQAATQHLMIFTHPVTPEAQQTIARAILNGKFGNDSDVLQAIAQHLSIFTDPVAQQTIARAIRDGKFGNDSAVFVTIFRTAPQLLALLDTQTIIHLVSGSTLSVAEKIEALRERKLSLDLSATTLGIPKADWHKLFGAKAYLGSEIKTLLPAHFPHATEDGIDSVCDDDLGYAVQIHHQQLLLYPLRSHQDQADFIGWMHPANGFLYKQCVTNIKIYDFAQLQGGYPTLTSGGDLSVAHNLFATLPAYLQQAIRDNSFDINQFRYANVIRFVTETLMKPLVARDAGLANKMLAIMQASIVAQGDYIKIAQTNAKDAAIKDAINTLCNTKEIRERSTTAVDTFLASLTPADKQTVLPRLAVLLGTMAKQGVLGYHHGESNQANNLLYLLASDCFYRLSAVPGITFPTNFHEELNQGLCIEALTNRFIITNHGVFHDVFATR